MSFSCKRVCSVLCGLGLVLFVIGLPTVNDDALELTTIPTLENRTPLKLVEQNESSTKESSHKNPVLGEDSSSKESKADEISSEEVNSEEPDEEASSQTENPVVVRTASFEVTREMIEGEAYEFKPFPDVSYSVSPVKVQQSNESAQTVKSSLLNEDGEVVGQVFFTRLETAEGEGFSGFYKLSNGMGYNVGHDKSGNIIVEEIDPRKFPNCGEDKLKAKSHKSHEGHGHEEHSSEHVSASQIEASGSGGSGGGGTPSGDSSATYTIDLMMVYSNQARDAAGGTAGIEAKSINAVAIANDAYENSNIDFRVELVYLGGTGGSESGSFHNDLYYVTNTDGRLDWVKTYRDQYGADLVAYLNNNYQYCGLGWLGSPSASAQSIGYSVTNQYCLYNQTLAHEMGHNMGATHDPANAGGGGAYSYSYGHHFAGYRTIMAYPPGTRSDYFSNPDVYYASAPTGTSSRNNARTLNNMAPYVANWRGPSRTISGQVTFGGQALEGVTVSAGGLGYKVSDASGNYELDLVPDGSLYTLTATASGYGFTPSSVSGTADDDVVQNFQANATPDVGSLADIVMSPGSSQGISISASDAEGDSLTFSAEVLTEASLAYNLDQQYNFYYGGNYYLNYRGANEKYVQGNGGQYFFILPSGEFYMFAGSIAESVSLATFSSSYYSNPGLLFNVASPSGSLPLSASVSGTTLTLSSQRPSSGRYTVQVSASDGISSGSSFFYVDLQNQAPEVSALSDVTLSPNVGTEDIPVIATDADGDALSYSVSVFTAEGQIYQLDQVYNFYGSGNYSYNYRGANEKYIQGNGGQYYFLLPSGGLYAWAGSISGSPLLAQVGLAAYADPTLLFDVAAPSGSSPVNASMIGSTLRLAVSGETSGPLTVQVTVSDGMATVVESFSVSVINSAPVVDAISDVFVFANVGTIDVPVVASDIDGDALSYSVSVTAGDPAYQLDQSYNFYGSGNYSYNYRGHSEKYIQGTGGQYFFILPTGALHSWTGSISGSPRIGDLDVSYYNDPSLLFDVAAPSGPGPITATFVGTTLRLTVGGPTDGDISVAVSVSDGQATTTRSFVVTADNRVPTVASLSDITVSANVGSVNVPIVASDADGDALNYSVSLSNAGSEAYQLDQTYNFYSSGNYYLNFRGANEKYILGNGGQYFFLLPTGALHSWANSIGASPKIADLDPSVYANPTLLFDVAAPSGSPSVNSSFSGSTLQLSFAGPTDGAVRVSVHVSDGHSDASVNFDLSVINRAPALGAISDVDVSASVGHVDIPLAISDLDGDTVSLSASVQSVEGLRYQLDQTYNFYGSGNYSYNYRGAGEKYLQGAGEAWFLLLPSGGLYSWGGSISASSLLGNVGTDAYANPPLLFDVSAPAGSSAVTASIIGTTLRLGINAPTGGALAAQVTANDGFTTTTRSFNVTASNAAPVLQAISDRSVSHAAGTEVVALLATDADGDALTYDAQVFTPELLRYNLDQSYDFYSSGNYYLNFRGAGEKYVLGDGGAFFFLLPTGALYRWTGTIAGSEKLGDLGVEVYANPTLLFDVAAPSGSAPVSAVVSGTNAVLSITPGTQGVYQVVATASDAYDTSSQSFAITIDNGAPTISAIADQVVTEGSGPVSVSISAIDPDGDTLSYTATVKSSGGVAFSLDQTHDFQPMSRYYYNYRGVGEKYVATGSGPWVFIRAISSTEASIYLWTGTLSGSPLLGTVPISYYNDPSQLVDVSDPGAGPVTSSISGSTLTLTPGVGFIGTVQVSVSVSDGAQSSIASFNLIVNAASGDSIDTDGDGVTDEDEMEQGTDPFDSGSFIAHLEGPIYTLWNSFLGMVNILELINPNEEPMSVNVSFYDISGSLAHSQSLSVPALGQFDLILNELPGFSENSYGIVKLDFEGIIDGRTVFYRPDGAGAYEFAFGVPLANFNYGRTSVGFNTFQPSVNPGESENLVANWLTIVNLELVEKSFTVTSYDATGAELLVREVSVPGFGRVDIDGGHVMAGPSAVGQHVIEPIDLDGKYLAQITRYGGDAPAGSSTESFSFAFPLTAKAGSGQEMVLPISRKFGEDNWLEVINTLGREVQASVTFFDENGSSLSSQTVTLQAYSQVHLNSAELMAEGSVGTARVVPFVRNSIISQSMFYFRNSESGSINAMYGTQAREAVGNALFGSYNLFLDMENWLTVSNPMGQTAEVKLQVSSASGIYEQILNIPANGSLNLPVHGNFNTAADSYGVVTVRAKEGESIFAELVRVKYAGDDINYALPTAAR